MSYQQTTLDGFQVPPGMMLVPAPQQTQQQPRQSQQQPQQSQTYANVSQYIPPTLNHNPSFKMNRVAPPPAPVHNTQTVNHHLPNNCNII